MQISIITAFDQNGVIGLNNTLPWHIPEDFVWFKENTLHKSVIMGHKTYQSIGKPLPNRTNIVLSRSNISFPGCLTFTSLETALKHCQQEKEVMIIGGSQIYQEALPFCHKLYITRVLSDFPGDTYFPSIDWHQWDCLYSSEIKHSHKQKLDFQFFIYQRHWSS